MHTCQSNLNEVKHVTLNPGSAGVVRIHMVPPRLSMFRSTPSVILLNGQEILPINTSWAILLCSFIDEIQPYDGKTLAESDWDGIIQRTVERTRRVYQRVNEETLKGDLWRIIRTLDDVANGREPQGAGRRAFIGRLRQIHDRTPPDGPDDQFPQ